MKNRAAKTDPVPRALVGVLAGLLVVGALLMRAAFRVEAPGEELTVSRL